MSAEPAVMTAEAMVAAFRARRLTPVEALQSVLERVARHNPGLNAFVQLDPQALAAAGASAERWAAGRPLGPLDGVPCTVKDLVDMEGLPTRRGSRTTAAHPARHDAPLVAALRSAGVVPFGKTTTTEFGWKTPGDCPLSGITRNPWDRTRTTGGSSAGAGAAGAAGFGPLHVGTDAGGSIRIPAAWCGLVGLKPSFGLVPQWPLGAFATVAVAGPMTRSVRDAALMLGAMAVPDWRDPFNRLLPARDWLEGIEDGVAGLRIARLSHPDAPLDADGAEALACASRLLEAAGARVEDVELPVPDPGPLFAQLWGIALALVLETTPAEKRGLLDPGLVRAAEGADRDGIAIMQGAALQVQAAHAMAALHQTYDLVLCPTVPAGPPEVDAPVGDPVEGLLQRWAPWTLLFNLSRQPAVAVPVGLSPSGLPRSVQLAAAQLGDGLVLRAARAIEKALPVPVCGLGAR